MRVRVRMQRGDNMEIEQITNVLVNVELDKDVADKLTHASPCIDIFYFFISLYRAARPLVQTVYESFFRKKSCRLSEGTRSYAARA